MPVSATPLPELLHRVFGHREFRPHQQPVCAAAADGRDVLLVMPTGAGKSLCYQLPALARGGTGLVISPLIALMDDQAAKLSALNLRVARIHSGLSRDDARQACRDYLDGNLDFLFIAPERLRVPGFPEMLARRKPCLIAIDEAHCISAWGHDFRPDYRTLGQHLPQLRPAPVIALTATATPRVQQDILRALALDNPAVFITGFRRHNLQIEVTELSRPQREAFIAELLADPDARPAIVYAGSRKQADELASTLNNQFTAAAYHAGLDAGTRDRVQRAFLGGKLDVVVATVAFGMGVDKADVRTVVHASLPGSVEGYYQEIGRAGRDGLPSRAVLLHSFADRKMHDFFIERDYPPVTDLVRVAGALREDGHSIDDLQQRLKMDRETVERSVDKLLSQGAAAADLDGSIRSTGRVDWQGDYGLQVRHRREQVDRMVAYTESTGCRMAALVRHFGDTGDGGRACGLCDACNPQDSASAPASAPAHQPSSAEKKDLLAILGTLTERGRSVGKVFEGLGWSNRRKFEVFLEALVRAGLISVAKDSFRSESGEEVTYRKASLTPEGRDPDDAALATVWLRDAAEEQGASRSRKTRSGSPRPGEPAPRRAAKRSEDIPESSLTGAQTRLLERLKDWRLARAKETGAPAFTVFHDSVLRAIVTAAPTNMGALGAIKGVGPEKLNRFAAELLALCRNPHDDSPIPTASATNGTSGRSHSTPSRPEGSAGYLEGGSGQGSYSNAPARFTQPSRPAMQVPQPTKLAPRPTLVLSRPSATAPRKPSIVPAASQAALSAAQQALETRLRAWRRQQAETNGLPTFLILSETALRKVAAAGPQSLDELRAVAEIGSEKLARYGPAMIELCRPGITDAI